MKDLCKAMGIEWVEVPEHPCFECNLEEGEAPDECLDASRPHECQFLLDGGSWNDCDMGAGNEGMFIMFNPSPTDEAFCWKALQYMMGREDWARFYSAADFKYTTSFEWGIGEHCFMQWLLSNPARFIKLANEWCREHKEVKP